MRRRRYSKAAFFRFVGYRPHAGQIVIHTSDARIRIIACGVRYGKTHASAHEALWAAMKPSEHSIGWVVGPTYDLSSRLFRVLLRIVRTKFPHRIILDREHEYYLVLRNFGGGISEIRAKSADNPVSLLGEGLDWVVIDEAARLKQEIWENYISQRLIDKRGWALLISTPHGKNYFFDLWRAGQRGDPEIQSWNLPSWTNPRLDRKLIEAERLRLSARAFAQEYEGKFAEGEGAVFRKVREAATGSFQDPQPGERYVCGLDLARSIDYSVLIIMNTRREVVHFDRFTKIDWTLQINRIKAATRRYNGAHVLVDVTGMGQPVYENILQAGISAEAFTLTAQTKGELISNLALKLEQGKIILPKVELCPELIDELEAYQFSVTDAGNTRMSAPGNQHDDCVIAIGLACWQLRYVRRGPLIMDLHELSNAGIARALNRCALDD